MTKLGRNTIVKKAVGTKRSVLIVEDGNLNYILLKALIEKVVSYECEIFRAENGLLAVEFCKNHKDLDLILMDIQMPVMDGFEATRRIKKKFPNLPIIAQTAYTSKENQDMAKAVGCTDFISKPVHKERIADVMSRYITVN